MSHRVVLVRAATTAGGGGCCGGDVRPFDPGGSHHDHPADTHPADTDDVAAVYRALCTALPEDVDVQIVAPTNWIFLLPELVRGGRRRGLRGAQLRRSVRAGVAVQSLVVDGAVLASGGLPAPARAVELVREQLALPRPDP